MADRTLVITWGEVVRGREELALQNFNDSVGLYGRLQQEDRIESFDVTLLLPNATMDGFMQITGSAEQIAALREDPEYQRVMTQASLIVDDLCVIEGYVNEGIATQMSQYTEAIGKVPQAA